MYSNICYNILSSILTPRYVILLRLRLVYDLFFTVEDAKRHTRARKKRVAKLIYFANALF